MNKKPLFIYHANCTDGFGAALAAWLLVGDKFEYFPMQYGFKKEQTPDYKDRLVYMFDFSWPEVESNDLWCNAEQVLWFDHHKTAFELMRVADQDFFAQTRDNVYIHLDNNKSGAMLAWDFFWPNRPVPLLYKVLQDRDLWKFELPETKDIIAGIGSYPMELGLWEQWVDDARLDSIKYEGRAINRYRQEVYNKIAHSAVKEVSWNGTKGVMLNAPGLFASDLGDYCSTGTFVLSWYENNNNQMICSVRSKPGSPVTANEIAKHYGGGGHEHASGFSFPIRHLEMIKSNFHLE